MTSRRRGLLSIAALIFGAAASVGPNVFAGELASYRVANGEIAEPLTRTPGNPARGRQLVRDLGHVSCLVCHAMPISEEPDHGDIGPPLFGVGDRLRIGELRLRLVEPRFLNPQSVMPSYYRIDGLHRVGDVFRGEPIYTAQEIEDVVAYLAQLRSP